jgi:hypothetical protein
MDADRQHGLQAELRAGVHHLVVDSALTTARAAERGTAVRAVRRERGGKVKLGADAEGGPGPGADPRLVLGQLADWKTRSQTRLYRKRQAGKALRAGVRRRACKQERGKRAGQGSHVGHHCEGMRPGRMGWRSGDRFRARRPATDTSRSAPPDS